MTGVMVSKGIVSTATAALLAWSSADVEQTVTLACQLRVTTGQDALRIDAIAMSPTSLSGQYRLEIRKDSATGSSESVQSGAFDLKAGGENILTTTSLDRSASGHYQARLVLTSGTGSVACVSP